MGEGKQFNMMNFVDNMMLNMLMNRELPPRQERRTLWKRLWNLHFRNLEGTRKEKRRMFAEAWDRLSVRYYQKFPKRRKVYKRAG